MALLAKTKLNIINVVISRALPDSYTSHKDVEKKKKVNPGMSQRQIKES